MTISTPKIVGLTGYASSGKDTCGQILVEHHGFIADSFARDIKQFAYDVDPLVELGDGQVVRYARLVDTVGVDAAKQHPDVRRLLQRIGTEGGRKNIHPDVWIDKTMGRVTSQAQPVVITDARFPDEIAVLRQAGGLLLRVDRPGFEPVNTHVSDTGVLALEVDRVIINDGDLDQLKHRLETTLYLS